MLASVDAAALLKIVFLKGHMTPQASDLLSHCTEQS
jgi:hypothetical protein